MRARALNAMKPGDPVFAYESGTAFMARGCVGL